MKYFVFFSVFSAACAFPMHQKIDASPKSQYSKAHDEEYVPHWDIYAGPHFNYVHMRFDNPDYLDGYAGGLTAGVGYDTRWFFTNLDFEGTWNASSITSENNQRSTISEYFLDWNIGPKIMFYDDRFSLGFYSGFGWDQFNNYQDPNGMNLKYAYDKLFIPLGLNFTMFVNRYFEWGIEAEWRPDVYSRLEIASTHFNNHCQSAFRVQSPFKINFSSCCSGGFVTIIPFYDWSEYGAVQERISTGATFKVPALYRWYLGLRVLLGYAF